MRKFSRFRLGVEDYVEKCTLSPRMAAFLTAAARGRLSILIAGGSGSGKTTTMNLLGSMVPHHERLVTIEDSIELNLGHPHVVALESRPPNVEGRGELTIRNLLKNSLRMRPDRILIGEVRGAEALDMLQAMNTGHDGSLTTIHANSARDAFWRLETMVLAGTVEMPLAAVRGQIRSAIDLVIHQSRMTDGSRKIVQIAEVRDYVDSGPVLEDIFVYKGTADGDGVFKATGVIPQVLEKLRFYSVSVPLDLFEPVEENATRAAAVIPAAAPAEPAAPRPVELTVLPGDVDLDPDPAPARGLLSRVKRGSAGRPSMAPLPEDP